MWDYYFITYSLFLVQLSVDTKNYDYFTVETVVVYICGFWVSHFPEFSLIFPHFFLNLKIRTTFLNLLKILKTSQIYHTTPSLSYDISLTNSYKSSQLNSNSLKHIHHQCAQSKQLTIYPKSFCLISISYNHKSKSTIFNLTPILLKFLILFTLNCLLDNRTVNLRYNKDPGKTQWYKNF